MPQIQSSMRSLLILVAVAGLLLGGELMRRRAAYYRKQAALCAYFELQCLGYAATDTDKDSWVGLTIQEKQEQARGNLMEAHRFGRLKKAYQRIAQRPWESLPHGSPKSVNGWDLGSLPAATIEEMIKEWSEE